MTVRSMRASQARAAAAEDNRARGVRAKREGLAVSADPTCVARATALARELYAERRRRTKFLPSDLFGEPTWDILLDLYVAARENRRVPTTSACIGAHVPPTTALRWLRVLEARGLVEREDDGRDGRRTFVCLSDTGLAAMDGFLVSARAGMLEMMAGNLRAEAQGMSEAAE